MNNSVSVASSPTITFDSRGNTKATERIFFGDTMFKEIPNYSGYKIDKENNVWNFNRKKPRIMKPYLNGKYLKMRVRNSNGESKDVFLHRLILLANKGLPPSSKHITRHLDGNPMNNDIENLEWGTYQDNFNDAVKHGTRGLGEDHPSNKLSIAQVVKIKNYLLTGRQPTSLARIFGVSQTTIIEIRKGEIWRHIPPIFPNVSPSPNQPPPVNSFPGGGNLKERKMI